MDRTAFAACAGVMLPLGALLLAGCGTKSAEAPRRTDRPAVLRQLQARAPGPWRRLQQPLPTTSAASSADAPAAVPDAEAPVAPQPDVVSEPDEGALRAPNVATPPAAEISQPTAGPSEPEPVTSTLPPVPTLPETTALPPVETQPTANQPAPTTIRLVPAAPAVEAAVPPADRAEPAPSAALAQPAAPATDERRTQLPWATASGRSEAMNYVCQRASERVQHGFQLAERGATYSARVEFVAAVQLIAEANDFEQSTRFYGKSLSAGLVALKEAADFAAAIPGHGEIDIVRMVGTHKTPVLKSEITEHYPPALAAQRYYAYAREHLAAAAVQEPCGSMALYGLAKLAIGNANDAAHRPLETTARAMTLFQAAYMVDAKNYRAANELGVMIAQNGDWRQARDLLLSSVNVSPQPATWHNLAVVYTRLGEQPLAAHAQQQAQALAQASPNPSAPAVQWLDPNTFAQSAPLADGLPLVAKPAATPQQAPAATEPAEVPSVARKGISEWLPWNIWR